MHQAGANSEDSISVIDPINTSSSNPEDIIRPLGSIKERLVRKINERRSEREYPMNMEKPRVWFITGASTGFGRELAMAALAKGDRVVATARNIAHVKDLEERYPTHVRAVHLDVTHLTDIHMAIEIGVTTFGRIDVLVNNAGYALFGMIEDVNEVQIRRQFETNVFGLLNMTRAVPTMLPVADQRRPAWALPLMRKQKFGHILNITSSLGIVGLPVFGIYGATKHAVEGFSEALAQEVAGFGIKVTIVEPGSFKTDFASRSLVLIKPTPAYSPVHDALSRAWRDSPAGDPTKAAQAMIQVVEAENPPLRLVLGADALGMIRQKFNSVLTEQMQWEDVSLSTDFDDPTRAILRVAD
jgi:NAD(P)-dependent dehydrogenase (short-subunit alcohol dehydrogenase family)